MPVQVELKWQDRSHEELSSIIRRGVQGGDPFFAASLEMERRAKEEDAARDAQQAITARTIKRIHWEVYVLVGLMALAVLILLLR